MAGKLKLIVGLGNPGPEYAHTRHNVGAWLVDQLANDYNATLKKETKFHGFVAQTQIGNSACRLLIPTTYMNDSGLAVASIAQFYKIAPQEILVAHDELDFDAGDIRLKAGGGHGGHNGLRDIISRLGNQKDFYRVRIGIGHPGDRNRVTGYVLHKPTASEERKIISGIETVNAWMPDLMHGEFEKAMHALHSEE
ncbi:MAG: aminoacyl-tRNA hydrolase [Coxiellaceae bacterium]|nr:aminoacyl-tRNA hydrolase [Coxiellaceae bacterium]